MKILNRQRITIIIGSLIILAVGVFLVTGWLSSPQELVQQLATAEKEINLSYRSYDPSSVQLISSFEEENDLAWQGNGFYDDREVFAGEASLALASTDRQASAAFTDDLPSMGEFTHLEIGVAVTDPDDLESLTIYTGTADEPQAYSFLITNLLERWNILRLPREQFVANNDPKEQVDWADVNRLEISLLSRPGKTIIANLDSLRVERTKKYLEDWNVNVEAFLGLANLNNEVYLLGRGTGTSVATLADIPSAKDFVYRATLSPLSSKRTGLFFRGDYRSNHGYLFWFGGIDTNTWGLSSSSSGIETPLAGGELTNVRFREGEPVWLEARAKGENITVSLSLDGKNYNELASISDSTLLDLTGGVGIYAEGGGLTLYNDFHFEQ